MSVYYTFFCYNHTRFIVKIEATIGNDEAASQEATVGVDGNAQFQFSLPDVLGNRPIFTLYTFYVESGYEVKLSTLISKYLAGGEESTDPLYLMMRDYPHIVNTIGTFVYRNKLDISIGEYILIEMFNANERSTGKDETLTVAMILHGMRNLIIAGENPQDILDNLLPLIKDNHVGLYEIIRYYSN